MASLTMPMAMPQRQQAVSFQASPAPMHIAPPASMPPPAYAGKMPQNVSMQPRADYGSEEATGKVQPYGSRGTSLPPPSMVRRLPRRRTQEARDIIAMQKLLPVLMPDGDAAHDSQPRRPTMEPTSSYVNEEPKSPMSEPTEAELAPTRNWVTPSTDHPLTVAESADMLARVQHDLLGMDISKLKGPLAEIARRNQPTPPPALPPINPLVALQRSIAPATYGPDAEAMTVSPKEAFLDYDQKLTSISPTPKYRERFSSPMPSLFAPLGGAITATTSSAAPFASMVQDGSQSPPFGGLSRSPTSQPLVRGQSVPAPCSPGGNDRGYVLRRSMEPEAAPRNAVRWLSAKREPPVDLMQMVEPNDGTFDWSPSSDDGESGLPLENPPTPPQPGMPNRRSGKPAPPVDISSSVYGGHPLSADLAYIHQVPEGPTFQPAGAAASARSSQKTKARTERAAAPVAGQGVAQVTSSGRQSRPSMRKRGSSDMATPGVESGERSTLGDDEEDPADSEDWTPNASYRAETARPSPIQSHGSPAVAHARAAANRAEVRMEEAVNDDEDEEEEAYEDEGSSDDDIARPAKRAKVGKGESKPRAPRQRNTGSRGGDGHILCDFVDPATGQKCNTAFRRPYDLARHKETKHMAGGDKPQWICDTCSSSFSRKDALMRHARLRNHKAGLGK